MPGIMLGARKNSKRKERNNPGGKTVVNGRITYIQIYNCKVLRGRARVA